MEKNNDKQTTIGTAQWQKVLHAHKMNVSFLILRVHREAIEQNKITEL